MKRPRPAIHAWMLIGLQGRVGNFSIAPPYPDNLKKLFFIERPAMPVIGEYAIGRGSLLFSLAHLQSRLIQGQPTYDPAAERLLLNILFPPRP